MEMRTQASSAESKASALVITRSRNRPVYHKCRNYSKAGRQSERRWEMHLEFGSEC